VRDGENIYWWDIVVISRRHTPYQSPVHTLVLGDAIIPVEKIILPVKFES
jgi:hypothetical protein